MKKIVVIGEILAEIIADSVGNGFREPIALTGPFPSGAPAIYAAQAARMGHACAIISAVGDDDFGSQALERLARDGVDISGVSVLPDYPTGTAFVRYRPDGARDFIFNIRHSACGVASDPNKVQPLLDSVRHIHVMGSSLSSPDIIALNLSAARRIKARGGTVSFDPNLRAEMLGSPGITEAMDAILSLTDLFLPSGDELALLTRRKDDKGAIAELFERGISNIVHKLGAKGVRHHGAGGSTFVPAFAVEELDPTGAGDCFGAAFTVMWLEGRPIREAMTLACAAGAIAVTRKGPMEGALNRAQLQAFAAGREERSA